MSHQLSAMREKARIEYVESANMQQTAKRTAWVNVVGMPRFKKGCRRLHGTTTAAPSLFGLTSVGRIDTSKEKAMGA